MRHPSTRQWSDFVRGLAAPEPGADLQRHLETGCESCARRVRALETVNRVAAADRRSPVPPAAVRSALDIFRIQKLLEARERPPATIALAFDSLLTPAAAGTRSEPQQPRHLVYESPRYMVGLQLHSRDDEAPYLTGQVLDTADGPIDGVAVSLLEDGRLRSQATSDRQGSFRLRRRSDGASRVVFLMPAGGLVEVEVPTGES